MIHDPNLMGSDHDSIDQDQLSDEIPEIIRSVAHKLDERAAALVIHHESAAAVLNHPQVRRCAVACIEYLVGVYDEATELRLPAYLYTASKQTLHDHVLALEKEFGSLAWLCDQEDLLAVF